MEKAGSTRQSYRENHTQKPVVNVPTLWKTLGNKVHAVPEETETERNVHWEPKGTGTARLMEWLSYLERNHHSGDCSRTWGHSLFLWQASILNNLVGARETEYFWVRRYQPTTKAWKAHSHYTVSDKRNPESTTSISVKVLKRYAGHCLMMSRALVCVHFLLVEYEMIQEKHRMVPWIAIFFSLNLDKGERFKKNYTNLFKGNLIHILNLYKI